MSYNLGVMNAAVALDTSDYNRKMGELPQTAESSFRKVAELAADHLSFRAISSFVKMATMSFAALENATWNFDQTFRAIPGTAAKVEQRMRTLYKLSEQTSKGMFSSVGDQLQAFGMGAEESLLKAKAIAERGIDLASYKGGNQADAVGDITRAMTGETEGMKKWGVTIRQGSKEFEDMVEQIQQTTGVTEELAKAQAILDIILKQTSNAQGDSLKNGANLAQTLTNIQQKTQEATSSMGAHLSTGVRPLLEGYDKLLGKFNELDPSSQKVLMQLTAMSAALILLQTSTGKAINTKIASIGISGKGVQAKAEAAAVEAAEKQKQASYARTLAMQEAHSKVALARIARMKVAEAQQAVNAAKFNLSGGAGPLNGAAQAAAKKQLITATHALTQAQLAESKATASVATAHQAARLSIAGHTAATQLSSAASATAAKATTAFGRAQLFVAGGLKAAVNGFRALSAAIGPIGWAIIAVTAAMSAWQYATGIVRGSMEKAARASKIQRQAIDELADSHRKERLESNAAAERLRELSEFSTLNNTEQKEAARLIEQLTGRYGDLGISLDKTTGKLKIAADAWDKMSEAQAKQYRTDLDLKLKASKNEEGELQNLLRNDLSDFTTKWQGTITRGLVSPLLGLHHKLTAKEESSDMQKELDRVMAIEDVEKRIVGLEAMRKKLFISGKDEQAERLKTFIEQQKERLEVQKEANEFDKTRKVNDGNLPEAERGRSKAERRAMTSLSSLEWDIRFNEADAETKAKMLTDKVQEIFSKQSGQYNNLDAFKSADRNTMTEQELKDLQQIVDLERQKKELRGQSEEARQRAQEHLEQTRYDKNYSEADAEGQAKMLDVEIAKRTKELSDKVGNKPESEYSVEELEIAKQLVELERQRAELRKQSEDFLRGEKERLAQNEEQRQSENARRQTDREIAKIEREQGGEAARRQMEQELEAARREMEFRQSLYDETVYEAEKGGVTDKEREQIQEAARKLDEAKAEEDKWASKIADSEEKDQGSTKAAVAYSSEMLSAALGASPTDKAIEKNTKQSVELQREANAKADEMNKKLDNKIVLKG